MVAVVPPRSIATERRQRFQVRGEFQFVRSWPDGYQHNGTRFSPQWRYRKAYVPYPHPGPVAGRAERLAADPAGRAIRATGGAPPTQTRARVGRHPDRVPARFHLPRPGHDGAPGACLLYTSDAADE